MKIYKEPTAFDNFRWDVLDWIADHGTFFLLLLIVMLALWARDSSAEEEYCYEPYGAPVEEEYRAGRTLIQVVYLDAERGEEANASYLYDEETDTTICKIWIRVPDQVIGDPDMDSIGHEVLHCLIGDFHQAVD